MKVLLVSASGFLLPFAMVISQFLDLSGAEPLNFDLVDHNHNGMLSREEAGRDGSLSVSFDTADTNRDGSLDPHEYLQARRLVSGDAADTLGIWY